MSIPLWLTQVQISAELTIPYSLQHLLVPKLGPCPFLRSCRDLTKICRLNMSRTSTAAKNLLIVECNWLEKSFFGNFYINLRFWILCSKWLQRPPIAWIGFVKVWNPMIFLELGTSRILTCNPLGQISFESQSWCLNTPRHIVTWTC